MVDKIRSRLHPEGYHGWDASPPYFEGWYFKVVDPTGDHRYALIPGISFSEGDGGLHSFVQVLDGATDDTSYHRYPKTAFSAGRYDLDVHVGPNHFSCQEMRLDLTHQDQPLRGRLTFGDPAPKPWPVTLTAPGIMGWYAWVPRMETYHGVVSLDHGLQGQLIHGDRSIDFTGGRGYIEKDWGQAFPSSWVWMQSNHFRRAGICITASIATIPWLGHTFPGFIVGLLLKDTLLRFATYTGAASRHLSVTDRQATWVIEDDLYRLTLVAQRQATGGLMGPTITGMVRPVPETLSATIDVELAHRRTGTTLFADTGRYAGLEVAGLVTELLE